MITPHIVAKTGIEMTEWEPQTMQVVRDQTTIPVPEVLRVVKNKRYIYLLMEHIPGRTLEECWDELSLWRKIWIAWKLRSYIRQLRRIRLPQIDAQVPGPLTEDLSHPKQCANPIFGEYEVGPFPSFSSMVRWFNERLVVAYRFDPVPNEQPEPLKARGPLVLTHGDLVPRNIILGDDGRLWIIDWGSSGVYPIWFEYAAMMRSANRPYNGLKRASLSWFRIIRFATGAYDTEYEFTERIAFAVTTFAFVPVSEALK
ncbi:unnamed protein product [Somion occarium]|uniref:Aminoglycoside phosphotransferase domain-containing protein n=1 Tax=Somion occarium TaxID=3059160 RepID=A0ABP1D133_9APHY